MMTSSTAMNRHNDDSYAMETVDVFDSKMAFVDTGKATTNTSSITAVFLHGNPTSSYIWRNIIPHVGSRLRCVAPDLIGMGLFGKPDIQYSFFDHFRYLEEFLGIVTPSGKILLVLQDWGSALGFHWAYSHQDRVAGLAFMEFIRPFTTWDDALKGVAQQMFKDFRTPGIGHKLIVEDNLFVNAVLPAGIVRELSSEELARYASPYQDPQSRKPVFQWPNQLPIEESPIDVCKTVEEYHTWLLESQLPKLLFYAEPGTF